MSLITWKREFYPIPADKVPQEQAIQHSLQKWKGLRTSNLMKHNCWKANFHSRTISDRQNFLSIDSDSCALCAYYLCDILRLKFCERCPLYAVLGGRACDDNTELKSPYSHWKEFDDPEPMIQALEKALRDTQK